MIIDHAGQYSSFHDKWGRFTVVLAHASRNSSLLVVVLSMTNVHSIQVGLSCVCISTFWLLNLCIDATLLYIKADTDLYFFLINKSCYWLLLLLYCNNSRGIYPPCTIQTPIVLLELCNHICFPNKSCQWAGFALTLVQHKLWREDNLQQLALCYCWLCDF